MTDSTDDMESVPVDCLYCKKHHGMFYHECGCEPDENICQFCGLEKDDEDCFCDEIWG